VCNTFIHLCAFVGFGIISKIYYEANVSQSRTFPGPTLKMRFPSSNIFIYFQKLTIVPLNINVYFCLILVLPLSN
jgi:hypothetical protein